MGWLSSEQALADYATLATFLRQEYGMYVQVRFQAIGSLNMSLKDAASSAVIAFGGSYGGMLSSWFRMKVCLPQNKGKRKRTYATTRQYPSVVQGAIAASAPIESFFGIDPPYNQESFAEIETQDASPLAPGGSHLCVQNMRRAFEVS